MTIYVAPMSVMDPNDPIGEGGRHDRGGARGRRRCVATADVRRRSARQKLVDDHGHYKTPFNVIVGATLMLKPATPVPTGKLTPTVDIAAHAAP